MKISAKSRLKASGQYGWYAIDASSTPVAGPFSTLEVCHQFIIKHGSVSNTGLELVPDYGTETNGRFESLLTVDNN